MSMNDELARQEAAYMARRAVERRNRRILGVVLLIIGLAGLGLAAAVVITSGGQFNVGTIVCGAGGLAALVTGLNRIR